MKTVRNTKKGRWIVEKLIKDPNRVPDGTGFIDYVWDIIIDKEIAGEGPNGIQDIPCTMHYSLFRPEIRRGEIYPLVIIPGGVGDAPVRMTSTYAEPKWQAYCPCYVLHCSLPYEGVVNWESQMYCMSQFAQIVRAIATSMIPIKIRTPPMMWDCSSWRSRWGGQDFSPWKRPIQTGP